MTTEQVKKLINALPPDEAKALCLEFLGQPESAVSWHDEAGFMHIFDVQRNQFVRAFTAKSGKEYIIRTPKDGISLRRATILRQMMTPVAFNEPLADIVARVRHCRTLFNGLFTAKGDAAALGAEIAAMERTLTESVTKSWDAAAIACTLFIVTPDEDLNKWDEGLAEKKIQDWNDSMIHEADFFFCCIQWAALWNGELTQFLIRFNGA